MTPSDIADALDEVVATQEASRLAYKANERLSVELVEKEIDRRTAEWERNEAVALLRDAEDYCEFYTDAKKITAFLARIDNKHDAWFRNQVQEGLASANAGNLIPSDEVEAHFTARSVGVGAKG